MKTLCTLILCAVALVAAPPEGSRRAPSFSLPDSKGVQHDILDYRGKLLIIDIMKTECPHCDAMTKTLEGVQEKYGDRLAVLSIVNYPNDNPQTVGFYINANRMKTPVLFDCGSVAAAYLNSTSFATPHVFLIDAKGTIRFDFDSEGAAKLFTVPGLSAEIDKILGGSAAPAAKKAATAPAAAKK